MSGFLQIAVATAFRELLPRSFVLPPPPRFTFGTFPADVAVQYYSGIQMAPIGVYAGTGFELSDGYVLHRDEQLVVAPDLKVHPKHLTDIDPAREAGHKQRPRRHVTGSVAHIISPGYTIYGHWLAEILPRLAVLIAAGESLDRLTFTVPADAPRFGQELLHLCGVPKSRIVVYGADEVVRADELLMPTLMNNGVRYAPLLADAVALFKEGVVRAGHSLTAQDSPERIFLARNGGNRRLMNREAIQAMAEAAGFRVVHPETMPLPDQIAMFGSVREIAGEYGSAFHTALFSPPGTVICGLRGSLGHPGFLQSGMGEQLGQPTGYVFGQSGANNRPNDFTIAETDFTDCLRLAFGANSNIASRPATPKARPEAPPVFPPPDRTHWEPPPRKFWDRLGKRAVVAPQGVVGPLFGGKK